LQEDNVRTVTIAGAIIMFSIFSGAPACHAAADLPKPAVDLPAGREGETHTAVVAGGCFWCTEAVFEQLKGVIEVVSGYAGDTRANADYDKVSAGRTNHAESIRITYDPSQITYGELLRVFFATHDPTTKDAQGPDHGKQYRSAIFFESDDQKRVAAAYIQQLTDAKTFDQPIVTTLEPLVAFYPAEQYHQDFVKLHPDHPYVRQWAVPKLKKLQDSFRDDLKPQTQGHDGDKPAR
jgi:peptide-methionine (S)-S-oxide reductase